MSQVARPNCTSRSLVEMKSLSDSSKGRVFRLACLLQEEAVRWWPLVHPACSQPADSDLLLGESGRNSDGRRHDWGTQARVTTLTRTTQTTPGGGNERRARDAPPWRSSAQTRQQGFCTVNYSNRYSMGRRTPMVVIIV